MKPLLVDLFCGAGGAAWGYHLAGFRVIGVDINPQPNYPFKFYQYDALKALDLDLSHVAAIHASPPCQAHTYLSALSNIDHPDLIPETRDRLSRLDIPWVIENVPGAPIRADITLCGSMFGLFVRRHRHFESNVQLKAGPCEHKAQALASPGFPVYRHGRTHISPVIGVYGGGRGAGPGEIDRKREAMGIPWMTGAELAQAIPPAYTEHIGKQVLQCLF